MHEVSLAINLITYLKELITTRQMRTLEQVTVQVGELSNVMPEAFRFAFEAMIGHEAVELKTCQLVLEQVKPTARCKVCHKVSEISHERKKCLYCGHYDLTILSGYELCISEVEGEGYESTN